MLEDEQSPTVARQDIQGLLHEVSERLDIHLDTLRKGSVYESVRPSDAKMFMTITRTPRTISQLARTLKISRQAAHASIMRLVEWKVIEICNAPGSRRDKVAIITPAGEEARNFAAEKISAVEAELEGRLGKEKLETLRSLLLELLDYGWSTKKR